MTNVLKRKLRTAKTLIDDGGLGVIGPYLWEKRLILATRGIWKSQAARRAENERAYADWFAASRPDAEERRRQHDTVFTHRVSFVVPAYNTDPGMLKALVDSLLNQTNDAWEVCFYDGQSPKAETREALKRAAERDPRIHVCFGEANDGISGNTNHALEMVTTDWVALLDHDDLVTEDAVYCVLKAAEAGADFLYSDEDKCDERGTRFFEPHLKGDPAPDTLRAGNYICHLMAMETALIRRVGALRSDFDGSQDHDLALRAMEAAARPVHIPRVLYHWRMVGSSASHQGAARCAGAAARAVDEQLGRLGLPGHAETEILHLRVRPDESVTADAALILRCEDEKTLSAWLDRVRRKSKSGVREVLLLGTDKAYRFGDIPCVSLGDCAAEQAAERARARQLVFLTQGVVPSSADWLRELALFADRADVACAGGNIMTKKCVNLFGGYAVSGGTVTNAHGGISRYTPPYMLEDRQNRNVTAVSRHLMMIGRERFLALGGFGGDATDRGAVLLGLRALKAGYLNVYANEGGGIAPEGFAGHFDSGAVDTTEPERYQHPAFAAGDGLLVIDPARPMPEA